MSHTDLDDNHEKHIGHLPSALENFDEILENIKGRSTMLCLDYDGTLTPIVEDYTKALISEEMRQQVAEVAQKLPVAVVSGRDVRFIEEKVNLEGLFYAGSHGFEINGPRDFHHELDEAEELLPVLDRIEEDLKQQLGHINRVEIERKKYAIAVHYRNVMEEYVPEVTAKVEELLAEHQKLKKGTGKMVLELKPDIQWDKGKAVEMICSQINEFTETGATIYIGDDVTDEDAFRIIQRGVGVLVGSHDEHTAADYRLKDVGEVQQFLRRLSQNLKK